VVLPPIIRSAYNCIYSIWYLSHCYCYLPLSWKSWNRFECVVGGVRHPQHILFCNVCVCVCVCVGGGGFVIWGCFWEYVYCTLTEVLLNLTEVFLALTEGFPCFFLSCQANARVILAKTGHGPHSSTLVVICIVRLLFVLLSVLFVCKCVLPPGDNPIAVNTYINKEEPAIRQTISYQIRTIHGVTAQVQEVHLQYSSLVHNNRCVRHNYVEMGIETLF
jgi:hypothetical protein